MKKKIFTTTFREDVLRKMRIASAEAGKNINDILEEAFNEWYTKKIMDAKKDE